MKTTEMKTSESRPRRHFDEDYKRHAVALTLQGQRTVKAIAQDLGVNEGLLYEWRRHFVPRPGHDGGQPQTLEQAQEEVARLRGEVVRLQEREVILKKSLGILSEPPPSGMPRLKR